MPERTRAQSLFWAALILSIAYLPSFFAPFYYDDFVVITQNVKIQSLSQLPRIFPDFFSGRGLTQFSFAFDWGLYRGHPAGFHLTNLLLHLTNVYLVYRLLVWLGCSFRSSADANTVHKLAYRTALLYGVHPLHTETVTYISSRSDALATFFYLSAFLVAARLLQAVQRLQPRPWADGAMHLAISGVILVGLVLGIGAKETIVSLPLVFLAYLLLVNRSRSRSNRWRGVLIYLAPHAAASVLYYAYRVYRYGEFFHTLDLFARPVAVNLLSQTGVIALYYLPRIVMPLDLNLDPTVREITSPSDPLFLLSLALLGGLLAWAARRPFPPPQILL